MTCLKIDFLSLMDDINSKGTFQVIPGLALIKKSNDYMSTGLPSRLINQIVHGKTNSSNELDSVLLQKVEDFIKTFSFQLQPENPQILQSIKTTGSEIINTFATTNNGRTGRSRKASLLWSAGILAAVGFAAMSAVAGKALMASLMALMVAALTALRGAGGAALSGYKTAHYEIITKPVHYSAPALTAPAHYYDHDHAHHGSSYAPVYDYARTISAHNKESDDGNINNTKDSAKFKPRLNGD